MDQNFHIYRESFLSTSIQSSVSIPIINSVSIKCLSLQFGLRLPFVGHPPLPTVDCPMEQNGYVPVCPVDPVDCAMEHNGDVPGCPVGPVVVNQSELHAQQPPLNCNQPNVLHQPESSIGQPQPSQPLTSLDISSPGMLL
jgi:hypothetical protein